MPHPKDVMAFYVLLSQQLKPHWPRDINYPQTPFLNAKAKPPDASEMTALCFSMKRLFFCAFTLH